MDVSLVVISESDDWWNHENDWENILCFLGTTTTLIFDAGDDDGDDDGNDHQDNDDDVNSDEDDLKDNERNDNSSKLAAPSSSHPQRLKGCQWHLTGIGKKHGD